MNKMTWQQTLEEKHQFEQAQKERGMIFQVADKERAAILIGLPIETFYHFPYKKWSKINAMIEKFQDNAWDWWIKENKPNGKTTMGDIWQAYKTFNPSELEEIKKIV